MTATGRLGLDTYSYHLAFGRHGDFKPSQPMKLEEFIERTARFGLHGFQIDPAHLLDSSPAYIRQIRAVAEQRNLWLEFGTCGTDPEKTARALETTKALGATVLRTFIGAERYSRTVSLADQLGEATKNLKQLAQLAEKLGIRVGIENHGDVTSLELVEVLKNVGSTFIGVCMDVGNCLPVWEDPVTAATNLAPYTVSVHLKDYQLVHTKYGAKITGAVLGQGILDLKAIVAILQKTVPEVRLNIEIPFEALGDEQAALTREDLGVQESVKYAREVLKL